MVKGFVSGIAAVMAALVALAACAPKAAPAPAPAPAAPTAAAVPAAPLAAPLSPQEQEWQKVLQAARKEGSVNFYATYGIPEVRSYLDKVMSERFGIKVEWVVAVGPANTERIRVEHRAKQYVADLWWAGASVTNTVLLRNAGALQPFKPPIVDMEPNVWVNPLNYVDGNWDILPVSMSVSGPIVVNTNLVRPEDYPKSYKDLLDPKWKGKIVLQDPTIPGGGSVVFQLLKEQYGNVEYFEQLAKQNVSIIRDFSEVSRRVAVGESSVALGLTASFLMPFLQAGSPIKMLIPAEGGYRTPNTYHPISNSPHPNAAKVLVNFSLTKEAQEKLSSMLGVLPVRKDATVNLHPAVAAFVQENKKWRDVDWKFMADYDKDLQAGVARKIFGIR